MKDICENRHGGNPESVLANASMSTMKVLQRYRIAEYIHGLGTQGAICAEVEMIMHIPHQSASARMTELKAMGILVPTASRRMTGSGRMARVCVHKAFAGGGS